MAKDLKAFLKKIEEDSAFAEEANAKDKSIAEAEKISNDRELTVRVGKEMGYEFTLDDINKVEQRISEYEAAMTDARAKEVLSDCFELDPEALEAVAGGCNDTSNPHDWVVTGRTKGVIWGYNLHLRCRKCGEVDVRWD